MNNIRIGGIDIADHKSIGIGLCTIHGIGQSLARKICLSCNLDFERKGRTLSEEDLELIRSHIKEEGLLIEGELRRKKSSHIKRLIDIKCYRGRRHILGLPVRGQRTRSNARTARRRRS